MADVRSWSGVLLLTLLPACVAPYGTTPRSGTEADLERRVTPTPWQEIGKSVQGRPIRIRGIGSGPRRVLWIGGIHGDETEGTIATDELPEAFAAAQLADRVTLTILEDVNPDGRANGTRRNANGVDLNRNYPASNFEPGEGRGPRPLSEPESRALHDLIERLDPHLVIVAHSWGAKPQGPNWFVNYDGPAEHLARLFSQHSGYPVKPSTDLHGTPGSLGSFVGIDRRIPILTLEYARGRNPRTCWEETREAILAVIASATGAGPDATASDG